MLKYVRWIAASIILAVLALSLPGAIKVVLLLSTPLACDEQIDKEVSNARGEVVAEHLRICFGLGAFVDYSITLQHKEASAHTTLAEFDPTSDTATAVSFRWIDDDKLIVDLGKVRSVWSQVDKVGSIRITYSYIKAGTN